MAHSYPPGPEGQPLLGSIRDFARDPAAFVSQLRRQYGTISHFRLAHRHAYLLSDTDDIKEVFLGQYDKFIKNRGFWDHFKQIFGNGLLTNEGDSWRKQRKLAAPAFQRKSITSYMDFMVSYTDSMMAQWQGSFEKKGAQKEGAQKGSARARRYSGGPIRIFHDDMMKLTAEIAAKALFDTSVEEGGEALLRAVHDIESSIPVRMGRPFMFIDRLPLKSNFRYWRAVAVVEKEIKRFIQQHRTATDNQGAQSERRTLLSMLMTARYDDGGVMSDKQLRDEVITLFLAGHDTTAISLSWTFYLLSRHPQKRKVMQRELDEVLGASPPTWDDLGRLPYTRGVLKEGMRLFPAAYLTGREAVEDVRVGDYIIPKGASVFISPWVMHHDEKFFPQADDFMPERWTEEFERNLPRYSYIPFGGGPRVCIGEHFSMMEAMTILAMISQKFELEYEEETEAEYFPSITLSPKDGMPLRVIPRSMDQFEHQTETSPEERGEAGGEDASAKGRRYRVSA